MILRHLKIVNFRCHREFELDFSKQITKITGRNGCGKTTIIEAIHEALRGKSFRAVDREIVCRDTDFYRVELEFEDGRKTIVTYDGVKKEFQAEDKKSRRLAPKSKYPIVLFEPDDLHLVGSSPTSRRAYFDRMFSQFSEAYNVALNRYNKALKQRNELLKQEDVSPSDLFSWDVMLGSYGAKIAQSRREYTEMINRNFTKVYHSIAENQDQINLTYCSQVESESSFMEALNRNFQLDTMTGHTNFGVHRDDFNFDFNGAIADGSASRGEVRSGILALKFVEADLITEMLSRKPVILLDDVFSELDQTRQKCLIKNFQNNQVIITSVGDGEILID